MCFIRSSSSMPARASLSGKTWRRLRSRAWKTPRIGESPASRVIRGIRLALLVLVSAVFWASCESTPKKPKPKLTGDPLVDGENFIENGPERDRVLWQYRTALAAMRQGKFEPAKHYLDN